MFHSHQMEFTSLEQLVAPHHRYRQFLKMWDFGSIDKQLSSLKSKNPHEGYGIEILFRCLLLQFMEDLSDRELELFLQETTSAKYFCGFGLTQKTPDHTVFGRARKRIGTSKLSEIFSLLRSQLKAQGYMSEVFTFVDSSHLIAKASLWKERDEAIKKKYEKLNNEVLPKVASDPEARIGCKGNNKYWYGYKKHISVDMPSGLINKVALTPANVPDANGLKDVCPVQGAVYGDKAYCTKTAHRIAAQRGIHLAAVKKNNMKRKNFDLDRYYTKIRAPYERVFSKTPKRVRYKGIEKNQFTAFMESICHNMKTLLKLGAPPQKRRLLT